ncbi:MAG: hypothetical protein KGL78_16670, partial [Burkholderiales bacterium]|nr:hypothetical protein [Burkholderiales bacterium]
MSASRRIQNRRQRSGRAASSRTPGRPGVVALAAALALLGAGSAEAASCTWNVAAGNWNALVNWLNCAAGNGNPASTPGSGDTATIGATGVVTINTAQSVGSLVNAGRIDIDAFLLTLAAGGSTTNTGVINVGAGPNPNNAALQVGAGHNVNNAGGTINVSADSVVNQFGSTLSGGTINTTGTGKLVAFNSGSNFLDNVALNGTL